MSEEARIARNADEWAAIMLGPDAEVRRPAFEAWRAADPRNAAAYAQTEKMLALAAGLKRSAPSARTARTGWQRPLAFASIAALVVVAFLAFWQPTERTPGPIAIAATDRLRAYKLADGSRILLDRNSQITIAYTADERRIRLASGRARFIVVHDVAHPFLVEAAGQTVTARGTVFDVGIRGTIAHVALLQGVVDVAPLVTKASHRTSRRIAAGQGLDASDDGIRDAPVTPADRSWPETRMTFDGATLAAVVAAANHRSTPTIRVGSPALGSRTVTGVFDVGDTVSLAHKLAAAFDLRVSRDAQGILIS